MKSIIFLLIILNSFSSSLKIYTEEWRPISYSYQGEASGYAVDIVQEILDRTSMAEEITILPWARAYDIALTRDNVVLFATTYTEERNKHFTFLGPIAKAKIVLYGKGIYEDEMGDIKEGRSISVYRSSQEELILKGLGFKVLETSTTPYTAALKFLNKRSDYWANTNLTTNDILMIMGYRKNDLEEVAVLKEIELYVAFSDGTDRELIDTWYEVMLEVYNDGTMEKLYQNYIGEEFNLDEIKIIDIKK